MTISGDDGPVRLPVVVYLRATGCKEPLWQRMGKAVAEQRWYEVRDFSTAWHLARGGAIVVYCDFSPTMAGGLRNDRILVQRVRARYAVEDDRDREFSVIGDGQHQLVAVNTRRTHIHPRPTAFYPELLDAFGTRGASSLDIPVVMNLIQNELAP